MKPMARIKKFFKCNFLSPHADNSSEKKAPQFLKGLQDQETTEHNEVSFRVKLSGYPQPRVVWYKDGKRLKNNEDKYRMGELTNFSFH